MRKAIGSYHTYSIPGKTAALFPECSEGPALGQNIEDDDDFKLKNSVHTIGIRKLVNQVLTKSFFDLLRIHF